MKLFFFALSLSTAISCHFSPKQTISYDSLSQDAITQVEHDDKEMNAAVEAAQKTLYQFQKVLQNPSAQQSDFGLKVRFDLPDGTGEHIWFREIHFIDNEFVVIVNNDNLVTTEVSYNDTVLINKDNISDWMYVEDGKLVGGFTTRVLRKRMSAEERKDLDANIGYRIED